MTHLCIAILYQIQIFINYFEFYMLSLYINESYIIFILYKYNVKGQFFVDSKQQRLYVA